MNKTLMQLQGSLIETSPSNTNSIGVETLQQRLDC